MNVIVLSRSKAIAYCHKPHDAEAVMISVSDPNMIYTTRPFCNAENKVRAILPLTFADADRPGEDVYGNHANESDLMTDFDAVRVAAFVQKHADKTVIVHCDAGISRSAGIAGAILKECTGSDFQIFDNPRYSPNMWCYRKVLYALHRLLEQKEL